MRGAGFEGARREVRRTRPAPVAGLISSQRRSAVLVPTMSDIVATLVPSIAHSHLILAQEGVPLGTQGESKPATETGTPGTGGDPTAAAPRQGFGIEIFLFGAIILFIVMTFLGGRREKKKYESMLASIKKHDSVRTVGGIIGSVVEVKPDVVVLKIDENSNTKITVARSKIEAVMKESTAS